jgi:ribosomal protein S18 acetylase RimI-like enzyme
MSLVYFKRYKMELALSRWRSGEAAIPDGYELIPWRTGLAEKHAIAQYRCFRFEIDANVFPCLGDEEGCLRLMNEISRREGFLEEATWLVRYRPAGGRRYDYCGTIQGVLERNGIGSIQNVGVSPDHRGLGLGSALVVHALRGFAGHGVKRVSLEVTADNLGAMRLYRRLGFVRMRTVYKAADVVYS